MLDDDFPAAFEALTGHAPLLWQRRLFGELARGARVDRCDIPTGLGKTSVIAIWLLALDLGRDLPLGQGLPRRLAYVVDRRAVVDQATEEAERIANAVGDGRDAAPVIVAIRGRLRLGPGEPLRISTLRGQLADNRAWLDDPSAPAIVVGTVDMIGSRLLFQGYNVSPRMRPVHAALLGNDAMIVLDEAHLVPPFQALIERVAAFASSDREAAPFKAPDLRIMTLSATGRGVSKGVFTLRPEDETEDAIVRKRLFASKRLKLEDEVPAGDLAKVMAERAWQRGAGGRCVIVFCNSRRVAQAVHGDLEGRLKQAYGKDEAKRGTLLEMIVGARRVREREQLADSRIFQRFSPRARAAGQAAPNDHPGFLVATSAGEVGVDLDADHMVCDLVPWERMVQRCGRVNRLGDFEPGSLVDVFPADPDKKDKEVERTVDGSDIASWRRPFEYSSWQRGDDGRIDASPGMLRRLRSDPAFRELTAVATTPAPLRPALTRALAEAWSMTSLAEHPGRPRVSPWLRGWIEEEAQTAIFWRRYLPLRSADDLQTATRTLSALLEEAPPHLSELLEAFSFDAGRLLRDRGKAALKAIDRTTSSTDGVDIAATDLDPLMPRSYVAAILSMDRKVERVVRLESVADVEDWQLAGRILLLDARLGGLDDSGLIDGKANGPTSVLDDRTPPGKIEGQIAPAHLWSEQRLVRIGFRVRRVPHRDLPEKNWRVAARWFVELGAAESADANSTALEWRVEEWVGDGASRGVSALAREDQELEKHLALAEAKANAIGLRLRLPELLRRLLANAAAVHDLGKLRANWQAYAGNPGYARQPRRPPLAKFKTRGNPNLLKIGDVTYRHEFGSLRDVIDRGSLEHLDAGSLDLLLHMVAAHHGYAHPVITPVDEKAPPAASAELARQTALRFVRLQKQWGPWGLAWWEALLRAADVAASRELTQATSAPESPTGSEAA